MINKPTVLAPADSPPAQLGEAIPMPPAIADLFPRLAHRAAAMLATGELVAEPDGTYTRHTLPEAQDQAA
jgi:hypothetical protein